MTRQKPPPMADEIPSIEDALAALSSKERCEEVFSPLSRDDIIDFFKQSVEMGIAEGTNAATISRDQETPGGEIESVLEQAVAVPIWMLAQAAVLLKTARPGRKQSMSAREQRIRYYAEWHYQRMKKKVGADAAASHISDWLATRGINLAKELILKGGLSRRRK